MARVGRQSPKVVPFPTGPGNIEGILNDSSNHSQSFASYSLLSVQEGRQRGLESGSSACRQALCSSTYLAWAPHRVLVAGVPAHTAPMQGGQS